MDLIHFKFVFINGFGTEMVLFEITLIKKV